jgi:hypothetical protein
MLTMALMAAKTITVTTMLRVDHLLMSGQEWFHFDMCCEMGGPEICLDRTNPSSGLGNRGRIWHSLSEERVERRLRGNQFLA